MVDATGDADVAQLAGAPLRSGRYPHSFCFRIGNVDVDKFVKYFKKNPGEYPPYMDVDWDAAEAIEQYSKTGTFLLRR